MTSRQHFADIATAPDRDSIHWHHLQSRYARQLPPEGAKGLLMGCIKRLPPITSNIYVRHVPSSPSPRLPSEGAGCERLFVRRLKVVLACIHLADERRNLCTRTHDKLSAFR